MMLKLYFSIALSLLTIETAFTEPLRVENILPESSIDSIIHQENYFGRRDFNPHQEPWNVFQQEYSEVFLKNRTQLIPYADAVDRAMSLSFRLAYGMEQLTQAELGIHEALGAILPSIHLSIGDGMTVGVDEVFAGLFSFLLPQNWLKLKANKRHRDVAKNMVRKAALDDYLNIQLVFLDVHRIIINVEIISFYLCHLQLLEKGKSFISEDLAKTLRALYSDVGLELSYAINLIGIHHNNLAQAMVVIQDRDKQYSANALRIDLIREFPSELKSMDHIRREFGSKERFVNESLNLSVELAIVRELSRIAGYQVGIDALGSVLADESEDFDPVIGVKLGYGTIPKILIARSKQRIARIDVSRELITFLDTMRRAYGNYSNSLRSFTEASRSVINNRELFYSRLDKVLVEGDPALEEKFIAALRNLIEAEVARNDQLHRGLRDYAVLRRYKLFDAQQVDRFLPSPWDIDDAIERAKNGALAEKVIPAREFLTKLNDHKKLGLFLKGDLHRAGWLAFGQRSLRDLVVANIDVLLLPQKRSRRFFRKLKSYLQTQHIELNLHQEKLLADNIQYSRLQRFLKKIF